MAVGGLATAAMGRGAMGDVAGYMMSRSALESLEDSGQGDSAMASAAMTGMTIAQIKLCVGVVFGIIVVIIFFTILSKMQSDQNPFNQNNQFSNQGLAPIAHLAMTLSHAVRLPL
jgi:hypothetical protein